MSSACDNNEIIKKLKNMRPAEERPNGTSENQMGEQLIEDIRKLKIVNACKIIKKRKKMECDYRFSKNHTVIKVFPANG